MSTIPLSLYVHFPWCVKKCPYCDFNSHELRQELPESAYINALIEDLQNERQGKSQQDITSIFLGGGTPSLFSGVAIKRLLRKIADQFFLNNCEITLEANPGTFDQTNFDDYLAAGVNRLSLGAQSFSIRHLQKLGRVHQADDILNAFAGARSAGFRRINIDLMFGLPNQDIDDALADLNKAIELKPEHISWYQLTIEPNTVFHRYPPEKTSDDLIAEMTKQGHLLLERNGYEQYEVSAFARPGEYALHNLNYWEFGDYLGIGAGAHGKLTSGKKIVRTQKSRVPTDYLNNTQGRRTEVQSEEIKLEFLMNVLRLTNGFELDLFTLRTHKPIAELLPFIHKAKQKGFVKQYQNRLVPTELGQRFLDEMLLLY